MRSTLSIFSIFSIFFIASCDISPCDNLLIKNVKSPNGKYTASVFERNCGATTPFIKIVNLHSSTAKVDFDKDNDWVFTIHGQSDVKVSWLLDDKLKVSYTSTGDTPTQREKWNGINITYE
jgi:hypothetical protein